MNYRMISYIISRVLFIEALLLVVPLLVSLYYKENALGFLVAIAAAVLVAAVLSIPKPKTKAFFSKEGFILCEKSGIRSITALCKKYKYNPLNRVPSRMPDITELSKEDFSL